MDITRDKIYHYKDKEILKFVNDTVIPRFKDNVKGKDYKARYIEHPFKYHYGIGILTYDRQFNTFKIRNHV